MTTSAKARDKGEARTRWPDVEPPPGFSKRVIIRLIGTAAGIPTEFDGKYVVAYDPTYHPPGEDYDGGILEVTDDPRMALQFPDATTAFEKWRQAHGMGPDGYPNRPLTAWTIQLEDAP